MRFLPVDDIADLDTTLIDEDEADELLFELLDQFKYALTHNKPSIDNETAFFLKTYLMMFESTHRSIRALVDAAVEKEHFPLISDCMSLCREQVEKVFISALFAENAKRWIKQYRRDIWRKSFETLLLISNELSDAERFADPLRTSAEQLERMRRIRDSSLGRGYDVIVSDLAKRVLTLNWTNRGEKKPTSPKFKGSLKSYCAEYFDFPTPGTSMRYINSHRVKRFLRRWAVEYSEFSAYTHATMVKDVLHNLAVNRSLHIAQDTAHYANTIAGKAVVGSYVAAASGCTMLLRIVPNTFGGAPSLKSFWQYLNQYSILSRSLWAYYVRYSLTSAV